MASEADVFLLGDKSMVMVQCSECGTPFGWTWAQRRFYYHHRLAPVKRCRPCRESLKAWLRSPRATRGPKPVHIP